MTLAGAGLLPQDGWAFLATALVALSWLGLSEIATVKGWLSSVISRKAVHIGTGPLYVLCWQLFSISPSAPWIAACVPGLVSVRFALIGLGFIKDQKTVMSMSRSGAANELLAGPLLYGVIHVMCTVAYWRQDVLGVMIISILCLGDGMADVMGRNYGRQALPWNKHKTWMGLAAFFVSALLGCIALVHAGYMWGWHDVMVTPSFTLRATGLAGICALAESASAGLYDNLVISAVAAAAGHVLRL